MARGKEQIWWESPKFTIDCVLANVSSQLEADRCVLEHVEARCQFTTPEHLRIGEFVKVQLWLEDEETVIDIQLAEVRRIHGHWVAVEVIQVSPHDRIRLNRFVVPPQPCTSKNLPSSTVFSFGHSSSTASTPL